MDASYMNIEHPHLELAISLADTARNLLVEGIAKFGNATPKEDGSPVTAADRACEQALRDILNNQVPDHGVWGEEFGKTQADQMWVLDPIDGTKAFITGSPLFSTLIAYVENNEPSLGVIEFPQLGQRWIGDNKTTIHIKDNKQTVLKDQSRTTSLADTNIVITQPAQSTNVTNLINSCFQVRYGGDAYNYACVATGLVDIALDETLQPYDYAALLPVLNGAGCAWSDFKGNKFEVGNNENLIVATNKELLTQALDILSQ